MTEFGESSRNEAEEATRPAAVDARLLRHDRSDRAHQHQHSGWHGCGSDGLLSQLPEHPLLFPRVLSTRVDFVQQDR